VPSKYTRSFLLVALPDYKIIFSLFLGEKIVGFGTLDCRPLSLSLSLSIYINIYGLWMIHGITQRISLSAIGGNILKS